MDGINIAFARAREQFLSGELKKFYHVTLAYLGNRLVVIGTNKHKSHPMLVKLGYNEHSLIHSELDVLVQLKYSPWSLYELDLVNFCFSSKFVRKGIARPRQSKPCKVCSSFVIEFSSITYYDPKEKWIRIKNG